MTQLLPVDRAKEMRKYLETFAASFGIYDMATPERLPNTHRALAMAEFARDHGKLYIFRTLAMRAHWREGKDLESDHDLAELAARAGLDTQAALEAASASEYLGRVDDLHDEARRRGVTGIPTFIVGRERVVGCQPYEVLAGAVRQAGAVQREKPLTD